MRDFWRWHKFIDWSSREVLPDSLIGQSKKAGRLALMNLHAFMGLVALEGINESGFNHRQHIPLSTLHRNGAVLFRSPALHVFKIYKAAFPAADLPD
jgi:hypothetical protein